MKRKFNSTSGSEGNNAKQNIRENERAMVKSLLYLQICKEHHDKYVESCKRFSKADKAEDALNKSGCITIGLARAFYMEDVQTMEKSHAIVVAFASMCLEAFIYDYAASNFSDTFVKNYIDKLDLKSKWVIVPQLVTGKVFDTSSKAYELLTKLVKYRNEIVHAKSKPMHNSAKDIKERDAVPHAREDMLTIVVNACSAIEECIGELEKIDNRKSRPWWWEVMRNGIKGGDVSGGG
jgi:hypothetical protein